MDAVADRLNRKPTALLWVACALSITLLLACSQSQSNKPSANSPMNTDQALLLTKAWCREARESFENHLVVKPDGGFEGAFGAADIIYSAQDKTLQVYGLVMFDASGLVEFPDMLADYERAGKRESYTLGEGGFFLLLKPIGHKEPQLTLRKDFRDGSIRPEQFVKEVDWLMQWSTHWRQQRGYDVRTKEEADLIKEGAELDAWARKNRPRPW